MTVPLTNLTLSEDIATQFGDAFISTTTPTIAGLGVFTGVLPTVNPAWSTPNTAVDMLNPVQTNELLNIGERFEIAFEVTVDPDAGDGNSQPLSNQAHVTGDGENFDKMTVTVRDNTGSDTTVHSTGVDNDNPSILEIPELRTTKSVTNVVANGENFDVTFELIVENTGSVHLTGLDLIDDVVSQLGLQFIGITAVTLDSSGVGIGSTPDAKLRASAGATPYSGVRNRSGK